MLLDFSAKFCATTAFTFAPFIFQDHDLSRNMPGKVKVSAPNLQKQKHKKK